MTAANPVSAAAAPPPADGRALRARGLGLARPHPWRWLMNGRLIGPAWRYLAGVMVVAGPWILSVCALGLVTLALEPQIGHAAIEDFRLTIIYALCVAPLAAIPGATIAARVIRDAVVLRGGDQVTHIFLVSSLLSAGVSFGLAGAVALALGVAPAGLGLAFACLSAMTALLWNCLSVLTALRQFRFMVSGFGLGMGLAVVLALQSVRIGADAQLLVWCFIAGMGLCPLMTMARLDWSAPIAGADLARAARDLLHEMRREAYLCAGIFFACCGVWIDKWLLWVGPGGLTSRAGYLHYSFYDSVMFVAHLSIIPSFAAALLMQDGIFTQMVETFRRDLSQRASYAAVRAAVDRMGTVVWSSIFVIIFVQATITATLVLTSPLLAERLSLAFSQLVALRIALVAVFAHAIFYLASVVLVLCGRTRLYFWVQLMFFMANLAASLVFYWDAGASANGFLASSLLMAMVSFVLAYRSLADYDYHILVAQNRGLYPAGA